MKFAIVAGVLLFIRSMSFHYRLNNIIYETNKGKNDRQHGTGGAQDSEIWYS